MELQNKVENLENQLKSQGRIIKVTMGLLALTIAILIVRWFLSIEGQLDIQGKRVYVHRGGGSLITSTMLPFGLQVHRFTNDSEPYGKHAYLDVDSDKTQLLLREDSEGQMQYLELFVANKQSGLSIHDKEQKERISLMVSDEGPSLKMMDENGQVIYQIP